MNPRASWWLICLLLVSVLLLPLTGCSSLPLWLLGDTAASFVAGWLAGSHVDTGETNTCYRNGEPVDCDTLPSDLLP